MTYQYPISQLILSHSSISTLDSCARKFEFSKLFGRPKEREEMFAAEVGKALHVGFQNYLIYRDENKAIFTFLLAYPHDMEFSKDENHRNRSLEACYATLMELIRSPIIDRYELIHVKTRFGDTRPAIEVPFAIRVVKSPVPIPIFYVGFVDAILYDRVDDCYLVCDIKTTRMRIDDFSVRYLFDEQTVPYGIILEQMLGHKIEEFKVSYLSAYIDLMEPKVSLYTYTKTQADVHDWFRGLCENISRIGRFYRTKWWPRATNGSTCFAFNRPCFFADFCPNRDPEISERLVGGDIREQLFHDGQEPWVEAELEYQEIG